MPESLFSPGGLHYRAAGSGPPLVLVHGWAMSAAVFHEVQELLAERFRVLAVDLPGHGHSPAPKCLDFAGLADALRQFFCDLELNGAALLGWSLGGMAAMAVTPQLGARIKKLVLVGTTPRFTNGDGWSGGLPTGQVRAMRRDLERAYGKTMGAFFRLMFVAEEVGAARYRQIARFATGPALLPAPEIALAGLATLAQEDLRPLLSEIERPSLVLHGSGDAIIPPAGGRYLADALPEARWQLFPGCGHAPFLSCPAEFCSAVEEFLA